jgi:hypothetical protein
MIRDKQFSLTKSPFLQTELRMISEERITIKSFCCSTVLIVDDEPFNLMPLEKLLSQH